MDQYAPKEIVFSQNRRYYSYDGELYTGTFPQDWAKNHLLGTGPNDCSECKYVGFWNGVFVGYCVGCAATQYHWRRGGGLLDIGEEYNPGYERSMQNTYLRGISWDDIGDVDFIDSFLLRQQQQQQEQQSIDLVIYEDTASETDDDMPPLFDSWDDINHVAWSIDRKGTTP